MIETAEKVLKDISTGIDGKTYCCTRIYGHLGIIAYIALCVSNFITQHEFNYIAFGAGFAAIIGGQGAAIWAKKDTEPKGGLDVGN